MEDNLSAKIDVLGINVEGGGSSESMRKIQTETSSYVSKELIRKQKELIKLIEKELSDSSQIRIIFSIDDLDKSWLSTSEIRYDFINALLEAFKELLDIKSVKILISIRTDILIGIYKNNLRQSEKDQSLIYPVYWNKKEIREILDLRIDYLVKNKYRSSQKVTFSDVFNFNVNGVSADVYIIERTMLRPRDAIDFVNLCLAECDGNIELNSSIILEAEEKFYSKRKQALCHEWKSIFSYIDCYLDSLSYIKIQEFNIDDISNHTKEEILNHLAEYPYNYKIHNNHEEKLGNIKDLIKIWFTVGVIGIKKTDSLIIYSSFDKQELDITDIEKNFYIHPLFFRYN
ncbi:MAG: hypothetical protein CENE_01705 [Candidatus Celerinatantimonas neptuna]|nr:MAG: hypothetical protein CENE_01705 [Candidatus Celerinatantimonas neptuna]